MFPALQQKRYDATTTDYGSIITFLFQHNITAAMRCHHNIALQSERLRAIANWILQESAD